MIRTRNISFCSFLSRSNSFFPIIVPGQNSKNMDPYLLNNSLTLKKSFSRKNFSKKAKRIQYTFTLLSASSSHFNVLSTDFFILFRLGTSSVILSAKLAKTSGLYIFIYSIYESDITYLIKKSFKSGKVTLIKC